MEPLHVATPLLHSTTLSGVVGAPVYLKMETVQPSGSFKIRGVGCHIQRLVQKGAKHLVGSSGGNAGLAMAYAASQLGVEMTICVPGTTMPFMIQRLKDLGANVKIGGVGWDGANEMALKVVADNPGAIFGHPFDHPNVWDGHTSIVKEISEQLRQKPSCIVVSVGGGGLICGILEGLGLVGWENVPVLAMETEGANCFNLSIKAGCLITMDKITSLAVTLGARAVTPRLMELLSSRTVMSEVVSDRQAVDACRKFLDDHRQLVEPSCGASLAAIYSGGIRRLISDGTIENGPIVMIVCGGSGVTVDMLNAWLSRD